MKLTTEYAILNVNINDVPNNNDKVLYTSQDPRDICDKIKEYNCTDEDHCIEEYRVDEDGDFYDGSNYDNISDFLSRNS